MILYKYLKADTSDIFINNRLRVSKPSSLNDPFEGFFQPVDKINRTEARQHILQLMKSDRIYQEAKKEKALGIKNKRQFRRLIQNSKKKVTAEFIKKYPDIVSELPIDFISHADKEIRISSFTSSEVESHQEMLMWAHYADGHKGIRIRCESDNDVVYKNHISKIHYKKERVVIDLTGGLNSPSVTKGLIDALLSKSIGWDYEQEYRLIVSLNKCAQEQEIGGLTQSYLEFNSLFLQGVDFGLRYPLKERQLLINLIKRKHPHVEFRQAKQHQRLFCLDYETI